MPVITPKNKIFCLSTCGRQNNPPVPRICECFTLHGKKNLADGIKDFEMGRFS